MIFLFFSACVGKKKIINDGGFQHGSYSSKFPSAEVSGELERITNTVKKIYSVSSYTTYQFRRDSKITGYQLANGSYKKAAWGILSTNETVSGTATVIAHSGSRFALLTCAHIISSPDTLITWFEAPAENPVKYIQSFSVKEKQENWVRDLSPCGPFTVLASDIKEDIAILGKKCEGFTDTLEAFPYPAGHARALGWGSFVYVFGFPFGNQMITSGIVSPVQKRSKGEFSVDALLNKGFSGGIIIALRNGVPDFELVGMVKSVNSSREEFLKPNPERNVSLDWLPYGGEIFVGKSELVQYGLNATVPMEAIVDFYKRNRVMLMNNGFNLDHFFGIP